MTLLHSTQGIRRLPLPTGRTDWMPSGEHFGQATTINIKECEKCRICGQRNHGVYLTNRKHGDYWHLIATGVSFPVTLQRYLSLRVPTNVTTTQKEERAERRCHLPLLVLYYLPHHSSRPFPVKPNRELQQVCDRTSTTTDAEWVLQPRQVATVVAVCNFNQSRYLSLCAVAIVEAVIEIVIIQISSTGHPHPPYYRTR